jgi:hypothetical protein
VPPVFVHVEQGIRRLAAAMVDSCAAACQFSALRPGGFERLIPDAPRMQPRWEATMRALKYWLPLAAFILTGAALLHPLDRATAQQPMGPGMMGQGCPGMMGPGMMDQGMMGQGMMDHGKAGQGFVMLPAPPLLSAADVTYNLERLVAARGNPRLKVGSVADKDAGTITGEIVTTDGSLVERYEVDKRSGLAKLVP